MQAEFTLASWNVFQGLHHSSRRHRWVPNPSLEADIGALDADVLVLPEAWRFNRSGEDWAGDLAARLGYVAHQWVADRPSRDRETVCWRMVVMTRVPARRLEDHLIEPLGRFGPRAAVRVALPDHDVTIAGVHLYGIHLLTHGSWAGWRREREHLGRIGSSADIVAGDFNMWGPVVDRDTPGSRRAVRGRTFPAARPHSQIDHVLVDARVDVLDAEVLPERGSDHRALKVRLRAAA